jgi:chemotaxis protein CheD
MRTVIIGMAEWGVVHAPEKISTLGLGSCVGVAMWDRITKTGGMVHIVLPDSRGEPGCNRAKFADTAIDGLLQIMLDKGAVRSAIIAKLAGGARMFGGSSKSDILNVGERNATGCRAFLKKLNIPVAAEDLGGSSGRTIELDTQDGSLKIKTMGINVKTI